MQRSLIQLLTCWLIVISLSTLNLITSTNAAIMPRSYMFLSGNDVFLLAPPHLSSSLPAASNVFARTARSDNDDSEKHEKPRPLRFGKRQFRVRMARSNNRI